MRFVSQSLTLSDPAFTLLRQLIVERTGIDYALQHRELLANKLYPRVVECGFSSFLDYYYLLKYQDTGDEWNQLINLITVQETSFWREIEQIKMLVEVLVPQHFQQHPDQPLRIWSAACATGEEPLTIAMLLREAGWLNHPLLQISATDISPQAIATAQAGLYRDRALRNLPITLRDKYFQPVNGTWQIDPTLTQAIQWNTANLMDQQAIAPYINTSVIFCRNVFIYFSTETIRKTAQLFYDAMPSPGYLFIAAAESLLRIGTDFDLQQISGAFVYVKP